jgi:hypothetical protein
MPPSSDQRVGDHGSLELLGRGEQAQRNRQVERRPGLADVRWAEVHRDTVLWEFEA